MDAKTLLLGGLVAVLVLYIVTIVRGGLVAPTPLQTAIGFVTAFFDTLGIGSFATTTAIYKLRNLVPVKLIPGTLNVGHTMPTIAQAFIYTQLVPVESTTLVSMIAAAMAGRGPRRRTSAGRSRSASAPSVAAGCSSYPRLTCANVPSDRRKAVTSAQDA